MLPMQYNTEFPENTDMEISGKNATFILVCQWIEEKKTPERADIAWIGKNLKYAKYLLVPPRFVISVLF